MVQALRVFVAFTAILLGCGAAAEGYPEVAPGEIEAVLAGDDAPLLLDVRSAEEFGGGHVPGALLIPIQELPDRLAELAAFKQRGIVTYCESGRRATKALQILEEAGFENLRLLAGSMKRWREEGREAATPD